MRRYVFAFFLFAATPIVACAALCDGATRVPVEIKAKPDDPGDTLPPGSYCFDVTVSTDLASKSVVTHWYTQREDQPVLPSGTSEAAPGSGVSKTKAQQNLIAATNEQEEKTRARDDAKKEADKLENELAEIKQSPRKRSLTAMDFDKAFEVRDRRDAARAREKALNADVFSAGQQVLAAREELRKANELVSGPVTHLVTLDAGDKAILKIWIDTANTDDSPTRTYTFEVETGGKWQLGYGFLFMPGHDKEYVSRAADSGFVIARKSNRNALTFAPGLIWSWYPNPSRTSSCVFGGFRCGFAAGIAADSSSPILFAGVQGTYHQNISFNLGVAVHQEKRLAGEYHEGQSLTESIDSDTLNKSVYRPNLYFGVSFRFDKSPF